MGCKAWQTNCLFVSQADILKSRHSVAFSHMAVVAHGFFRGLEAAAAKKMKFHPFTNGFFFWIPNTFLKLGNVLQRTLLRLSLPLTVILPTKSAVLFMFSNFPAANRYSVVYTRYLNIRTHKSHLRTHPSKLLRDTFRIRKFLAVELMIVCGLSNVFYRYLEIFLEQISVDALTFP